MPLKKTLAFLFIIGGLGVFIAQVSNKGNNKSEKVKEHETAQFLLEETTRFSEEFKFDSLAMTCDKGEDYVVKHQLDSFYLAAFRQQKGGCFYYTGDYTKAIKWYNFSIEATKNDEKGLNQRGTLLYDRSQAEYALGRVKPGYLTTLEAEAILSKLEFPDYDFLVSVYIDLAFYCRVLGYFDKGEQFLIKATRIHDEHSEDILYLALDPVTKPVSIEYTYVLLYVNSGDEKKLIYHLNELEKLVSKDKSGPAEKLRYTSALSHVFDYYLMHYDDLDKPYALDKAEFYLEKTTKLLDHKKYKSTSIQLHYNSVKLLTIKKEYTKALQLNKELLLRMTPSDLREPYFLAQRGMILQELGELSEAKKVYYTSIAGTHTGDEPLKKDFSNFTPSYNIRHASLILALADTIVRVDDNEWKDLAFGFYSCGMKNFQKNFTGLNFNAELTKTYNGLCKGLLLRCEMKQKGIRELANLSESIENQLLWSEFLQNREHSTLDIPDSLQEKEYELRLLITQYKNEGNDELFFQTSQQLEKHTELVREKYPNFARFNNASFDVSTFQKGLTSKALVMRFFQFEDALFRLDITQKTLELTRIKEAKLLQNQISEYIQVITKGKENIQLSKTIAKGLLPSSIWEFQDLTILSNGNIGNLPFETLSLKNEYLLSSFNIAYAPHLIFLQNDTHKEGVDKNNLVVFSPSYEKSSEHLENIKGAQKESELLIENYAGTLFKNSKATRKQFFDLSTNISVLHLSMHASIDKENSSNSCLYFHDKKLYLEELYGANLNTDLVVLSACNTGSNIITDNSGNLSLQRAFIYAGVSSTISSLWEVPDKATNKVMLSFYEFLENGLSKSEALRRAKLHYLETTSDPHLRTPYYWAGFVISGDVSPVELTKNGSPYWKYLIWFLVVGGILVFLFYRFRSRLSLTKLYQIKC